MTTPAPVHRPRISRETRRLLTAAIMALVALWVLARVRFPDRPAAPGPVQPLIDQLSASPRFGDLAAEIAQLRARLRPALLVLREAAPGWPGRVALRVRDDLALAYTSLPGPLHDPAGVDVALARDPASGLTVVQALREQARLVLPPWMAMRPDDPRYLAVATTNGSVLSLRPVFVPGLLARSSPLWPGPIWEVLDPADLPEGGFAFSFDGELAGLIVPHGDGAAIVPGSTLMTAFGRLQLSGSQPTGDLGVQVQELTPALSSATGTSSGVVVTWVDPQGPSAESLADGDVLETANDRVLETPDHWRAEMARLRPGDPLTVLVNRRGERHEVTLLAAAPRPMRSQALGLSLRSMAEGGSEVVGVAVGSSGEAAGVRAGDIITLIGDIPDPTPAQVRRVFGAATRPVLVIVRRNGKHVALALAR